jgi:hypothetical protein
MTPRVLRCPARAIAQYSRYVKYTIANRRHSQRSYNPACPKTAKLDEKSSWAHGFFSGCRLNDLANRGPAGGTIFVANVDNHGSPSVNKWLTLAFRCALNGEVGKLYGSIALNQKAPDIIFLPFQAESLEHSGYVSLHGLTIIQKMSIVE